MSRFLAIKILGNGDFWKEKELCKQHGINYHEYLEEQYKDPGCSRPTTVGNVTFINTLAGTGGAPPWGTFQAIAYADMIYNGCGTG